jgi:ABC-type molybdenum transport system ATPase subunit/photorepair protein PhrA
MSAEAAAPATSDLAIDMQALTKRYGAQLAVDRLRFGVAKHRITGLLGRNGAGKSTTLKMLLGMIAPTSGTALVLDRRVDDRAASLEIRRQVAYVSEGLRRSCCNGSSSWPPRARRCCSLPTSSPTSSASPTTR